MATISVVKKGDSMVDGGRGEPEEIEFLSIENSEIREVLIQATVEEEKRKEAEFWVVNSDEDMILATLVADIKSTHSKGGVNGFCQWIRNMDDMYRFVDTSALFEETGYKNDHRACELLSRMMVVEAYQLLLLPFNAGNDSPIKEIYIDKEKKVDGGGDGGGGGSGDGHVHKLPPSFFKYDNVGCYTTDSDTEDEKPNEHDYPSSQSR
ncbi:hypothetical protein LWI28_007657 [Acer negundo]|uniref:Uncharacterized protein n=1 Tax=Acer negundo TaxID=4023 RepID=A0AAD5ICR1_ACENE|nr:hypothetical protein LWI28_007657 [Acer negundo]